MIGADARIPLCGSEQAAASRKDEAYRLPGNEGNCRMAGGHGATGFRLMWTLKMAKKALFHGQIH